MDELYYFRRESRSDMAIRAGMAGFLARWLFQSIQKLAINVVTQCHRSCLLQPDYRSTDQFT